jgi:hypothetical protein
VVFTLEISPSAWWEGAKVHWSGTIVLPVEIVPKAPPTPIDSPDLTDLVRRTASVSCSNGFFQDGPSIWLNGWAQRPPSGPLTSALMNLKADLLKDGVVVATELIDDPDEAYGDERWGQTGFVRGDMARAIVLRKDIERYTVRVSGVAPTKPSRWCRVQYWSGEYTVPLIEILEPECGMRPAGLCGPDGT